MKATKKIATVYPDQSTRKEFMNSNEYARIEFIDSSYYIIVDTANQCRFVTTSELKAKNYLAKTLKYAGITK
jgi:hypothetical protein